MSITFNHTIIHVLDLSLNMPVLSAGLFPLDDETEAFITKHLIKLFESPASARAYFNEEAILPTLLATEMNREHFINLSGQIAEKYYEYLTEYQTIPDGDLIITHFLLNDSPYLAVLKLNYKEAFTHHIETNNEGVTAKIIKHRGIFPSGSKQIDEGIIIDLESLRLTLLDQTKSGYLSLLFECSPELSVKKTMQLVEKVASDVIETHYDNAIEAMSELKSNIADSLSRTQTLPIQEVMQKTFERDEEVFESCMNKMDELGLKETTIEVTDAKLSRKYDSHRLKTDTGIELKFPTPLFKNPDFIEFITEPDGTLSILLKNISQIINK